MIGVINFGMGNLASIQNALDYICISNEICGNPKMINKYNKLILPGVGAFGVAANNLKDSGFFDQISEYVCHKKIPILGICLGMQLFLDTSTEHGHHEGFGFIKGSVRFMDDLDELNEDYPIPHIGWNNVIEQSRGIVLSDCPEDNIYYFVHSYYCDILDKSIVTGRTHYGFLFDSVIEKENIFGCQFHPEKSQKSGLDVLKRFCKL